MQWVYTVDDSLVEYLAAGETRIEKFTVSVDDGHGGVATQEVSIIITGTNDAPTGSSTIGSLSGTEDTPLMIYVADLLQGFSDRDASDTLSVANLSVNQGGQLQLLNSGDYQFTPAPNFNGSVTLSYDVIDNHGGVAQGSAVMNIASVNDAPTITSNGGANSASINFAENSSAPITIVQADDPDNHPLVTQALIYSIVGGADMALFSINANSGELVFNSAPNFEAPADSDQNNSYLVTVRASDGALFADQELTVNITNVNEAPVISSDGGGDNASISIPENSTTVTTVVASDIDAGSVLTYSLSGADANKFSITNVGVLSFINSPDFETPTDAGLNNIYDVTVTVSDNGASSLSDTQTFHVNISDVSEVNQPPVISNLSITEGSISFNVNDPNAGDTLSLTSPFDAVFNYPPIIYNSLTLFPFALSPGVSGTLQVQDNHGGISDVMWLYIGSDGVDIATSQFLNGSNAIYGFGGDDTLVSGVERPFTDYLLGGAGSDTYIVHNNNTVIYELPSQ